MGNAEGEETRKHGTLAWRVDASGEVREQEQKAQGWRPPEWKVEGETDETWKRLGKCFFSFGSNKNCCCCC